MSAPDVAQLRRLLSTGPADRRGAWEELAVLGVPALLVPPSCGGLGCGIPEAVEVATELGSVPPLPFVVSAVLATRLLEALDAGSLLAELATGDRVLDVQVDGRCVAGRPLDPGSCDGLLRLTDCGATVEVELVRHDEVLPLGRLRSSVVRQALDDASVVAAAELLASA